MGTLAEMQNENSNPPLGAGALSARRAPFSPGAPAKNLNEKASGNFTPPRDFGAHVFSVLIPPAPSVLPAVEKIASGEYHPGYIDQMLAYFDRPKMKETIETFTYRSGAVDKRVKYVANTPPHFSEFARQIGVTTRKLKLWAKNNPAFREAYETCQEIFEEFMIDNGLTGQYGAIAMKFVAVNRTKMRDKTESLSRTVNMNEVLDQIAAGKSLPGGRLEESESVGDDEF